MATKKEKGDETTPKKGSKKGSKKKRLILVIAAVLLLGGGAGGYLMLTDSGSGEPAQPEPGVVVALEAVTINLADGHYLKVSLGLQATTDAAEEPDGSKALDLAIEHFGDIKMAELSTSTGRKKAKEELAEKVEEAYHGEVMDIYYREFVMQ